MNTSQAEQVLKRYLENNYAQIRDIGTTQIVINAMLYFAALALSEAKDENIAAIKDIKDEDIELHTYLYLGNGDTSTYFNAGAKWMRDKIIELL